MKEPSPTRAESADAWVHELVSKVDVFLEFVTSFGRNINEKCETVARALETKFERMPSAISLCLPPVWLLLTTHLTNCVIRLRLCRHPL